MTDKRYRISAISYTNTLPFLYGLKKSGLSQLHDISIDTPAECARKLRTGGADIGLVPVAAIPSIPSAQRVGKFGIGADGPVQSVLMIADVPLHEIKTVLLDYQSLTSVQLVKILAAEFWKKELTWIPGEPGFEGQIGGSTAGVVIGDRALQMEKLFRHNIDLAAEWKAMTGLPFLFAAWVGTTDLDAGFVREWDAAMQMGVDDIRGVLADYISDESEQDRLQKYLQHIRYEISPDMLLGMERFLSVLPKRDMENVLSEKPGKAGF